MVENLEWVTADQQRQLDELIRGDWREWLPTELDAHWPAWRQADPDDLGAYLDEVLPGFGQEPVDALDWVTSEQQAHLNELWEARGDWREWLPTELDTQWPQWRESTQEQLTPWLDSLLPALLPTTVESLDWVTSEQQTQLNELWEIRGDWREWLPTELDTQWAQWRQSTPDDLAPWLDRLIPGLVLPDIDVEAEVAAFAEQVVYPTLADFYDRLDELAERLGVSEDELLAEIDELPDTFFLDRLAEIG